MLRLLAYTYKTTGTTDRVSSNLVLDAAGVRDLDIYGALQERYSVAGFPMSTRPGSTVAIMRT